MAIWKDSQGVLHDDMGGMALELPNWPKDMKQLTEKEVAALSPAWSPEPLLNRVRAARKIVLDSLIGIGLDAQANGDSKTLALVLAARSSLLDITSVTGIDDDSLKAEINKAYAAIIKDAGAKLKNAFVELDL